MHQPEALLVRASDKAKLSSLQNEAASERAFAVHACTIIVVVIGLAWFFTG